MHAYIQNGFGSIRKLIRLDGLLRVGVLYGVCTKWCGGIDNVFLQKGFLPGLFSEECIEIGVCIAFC